MTTLDLYCAFRGWQGGTIHQALADFKSHSKATGVATARGI